MRPARRRYWHSGGRAWLTATMTAITLAIMGITNLSHAHLFAAGSLRDAFVALMAAYRERTGVEFVPLFGPSGKLREQIERGDVPAVFASASIEHTDALFKAGILRESVVLARNRLCVLARPGISLDADRLLDLLLDPAIRVGTSTPGADPSGDYTWAFFRNAGSARPGAFTTLDAKALQLTGREVDPQQQEGTLRKSPARRSCRRCLHHVLHQRSGGGKARAAVDMDAHSRCAQRWCGVWHRRHEHGVSRQRRIRRVRTRTTKDARSWGGSDSRTPDIRV